MSILIIPTGTSMSLKALKNLLKNATSSDYLGYARIQVAVKYSKSCGK